MRIQVGTEWLVDAAGCDPERLRDGVVLHVLCERLLLELELEVVGTGNWHGFGGPGGWTGMYLLTESHLCCHSYPEHGIVTINLHCCRRRPRWSWEERLREAVGAREVHVREVVRGEIKEELP